MGTLIMVGEFSGVILCKVLGSRKQVMFSHLVSINHNFSTMYRILSVHIIASYNMAEQPLSRVSVCEEENLHN